MKKCLLILLAVLLLAGCTPQPQPQPEPPVDIQDPEPVGLYTAGSEIEQQTKGAVREYALQSNDFWTIENVGDQLLVVGDTQLMVLSGDIAEVAATLPTGEITPSWVMEADATGILYYLPDGRQLILLNPQLQQTAQMELPESIVGTPVISMEQNEVFYSTGSEVRALNVNTGIARLLRRQADHAQTVLGAYFDGTVLLLQNTEENGNTQTEYISSETGQTLWGNGEVLQLFTHENSYFLTRYDGRVFQTLTGTTDTQPQLFTAPLSADTAGKREVLLELDGVFDCEKTTEGLSIAFYTVSLGKKTAALEHLGISVPSAVHCDGKYIWFLAQKSDGSQCLYRWDVTKSPVQEETSYIAPLYTVNNPDTASLVLCQTEADTCAEKYGVEISVWEDALKNAGQYTVVPEHQVQTVSAMITELDAMLALFPEGFLEDTLESGDICISLVRSISGNEDWVQYWQNGDCHILVSSGAEAGKLTLQGITYAVDSHVLGNSRDFDDWSDLNPEEFVYTYNAQVTEPSPYLEESNRAFVDQRAMTDPREDRCRTLYYAMLPDNQTMFSSAVMQEKLLRLCLGIREAYGLEEDPQVYSWEQYLETPAYEAE